MAGLPMEEAAADALATRASFAAQHDFGAVELVEIDTVAAFRRLLRDGSPLLRRALVNAALDYVTKQ
jgi:hypothetical protein